VQRSAEEGGGPAASKAALLLGNPLGPKHGRRGMVWSSVHGERQRLEPTSAVVALPVDRRTVAQTISKGRDPLYRHAHMRATRWQGGA
jgi:hypothetical protein